MLDFTCANMSDVGGDTALVASCKYVAVYDNLGNCKVLEAPTAASILVSDGTDIYFADGSDGRPVRLPMMSLIAGDVNFLIGMTTAGTLFKTVGPSDGVQRFISTLDGVVGWAVPATIGVPAAGFGLLKRDVYEDPSPAPAPSFLNTPGVIYIGADGSPLAVGAGVNGQQLVLVNQIPTWVNQSTGSIAAGTSYTGLSGVSAQSTSNHTITVQAPSMTLDDGTGTTFLAINVNVAVDIEGPIGVGARDTGVETNNTWYYVYIISNGTLVNAMISASPTAPDFVNAPGYSFYALASVVRNDNVSSFVPFIQRGRSFHTAYQIMSDPVGITTGFNPISQGTPLDTIIPPLTKYVSGVVGGSNAASEGNNVFTYLAADATGTAEQVLPYTAGLGAREGFVMNYTSFYRLPIVDPVSPAMYWKGSQASTKRRVVINGYEI